MNERCECHDCTQARWKSSFQGQMAVAVGGGTIVFPYTSNRPMTSPDGCVTTVSTEVNPA